ncbi:3TM-type holin [Paracoccaceae bacterium]|nr:3TM-type holin [Paracoccaceae bacterium]
MKELLSGLIGPVTGIINKVVPDKDEAARRAYEISTMADRHAQALAVAQIEVNRAEAAGNWFQASWRPLCRYF